MSMLLLISGMLCACSSDEEDETSMLDEMSMLYGYWEYAGITYDGGPLGFYFQKDGKIKSWHISINDGEYSETNWGLYWYEETVGNEKSMNINIKVGNREPNPDEMYYAIETLTESRLVIRVFGGFKGTPYEDGYNLEYMKLPGKPQYYQADLNMNKAETSDLLGYWKVIADNQTEIKDSNSQSGLCFKNDGEIIEWAMNSESWYEIHRGKWWVSDEGDIMVDVYEGVMCRIYTAIERLSKTHLVIRSWGGFVGTPREEGYDVEYLKLENAPNYDNLNQIQFPPI